MKWRVYNMHPDGLTHREKFRDEMIEIKAKDYVLMDYEDAVLFRGQYFPMKLTADGGADPVSFKVIKIEPDSVEAKPSVEMRWVCHVDGKEFPTKSQLEAYVEAKYGDLEPFRDESIEAELEKQATTEEVQKRKPGRPPREKTL